ncbi:MAG: metalloregulator ArsR/SmtB family transcription factor [Lutisporaceae bacterium]
MEQAVQIFKALGDETRLKILFILSKRRICAKGIAKHLNISEAAVSQHIRVLKDARLIIGEKVGYYVNYDLQKPILLESIKFIKHITEDSSECNCKFNVYMPDDCTTMCKSNRNKCCEKKDI